MPERYEICLGRGERAWDGSIYFLMAMAHDFPEGLVRWWLSGASTSKQVSVFGAFDRGDRAVWAGDGLVAMSSGQGGWISSVGVAGALGVR